MTSMVVKGQAWLTPGLMAPIGPVLGRIMNRQRPLRSPSSTMRMISFLISSPFARTYSLLSTPSYFPPLYGEISCSFKQWNEALPVTLELCALVLPPA